VLGADISQGHHRPGKIFLPAGQGLPVKFKKQALARKVGQQVGLVKRGRTACNSQQFVDKRIGKHEKWGWGLAYKLLAGGQPK
jgi:hypothetical protein